MKTPVQGGRQAAAKKPVRLRALARAKRFVGVTEKPPGSNCGPQIDQWNLQAAGTTGVYWCCSFLHGVFRDVGYILPGGASVGILLTAARSKGWVVSRPLRGDLVCFEFGEGAYRYDDHIGIVERVLAVRWANGTFTGWIQTIEGNTSAQGKTGSQSNGGGVFRRRRWVRGIGATFVRVPG
jgi:hypothetical protein